jgi:hypothetical protein
MTGIRSRSFFPEVTGMGASTDEMDQKIVIKEIK